MSAPARCTARKFLVKEVQFGSDGKNLFLRLDFRPGSEPDLEGAEARLAVRTTDGVKGYGAGDRLARMAAAEAPPGIECAFGRVLEARIPLAASGLRAAPGCASSSRSGRADCRWTPCRSRAGWRCPPQTRWSW